MPPANAGGFFSYIESHFSDLGLKISDIWCDFSDLTLRFSDLIFDCLLLAHASPGYLGVRSLILNAKVCAPIWIEIIALVESSSE